MKIIRWKYAAPLLIFIVALCVFFIFFFDALVSRGIEIAATKANGAKVNVSGFKTKFLAGRVSIGNVQITNKNAPMENLIEMGPMAFQLELSPVFKKCVVIDEASLSGIRFNTPRKTSGALRVEPKSEEPSAAAQLASKYKDQFKLNLDGIKGDVKQKIDIDPKELEITKRADALKTQAEAAPAEWNKKIDALDVENRLKKVEADLKDLKLSPETFGKVKQAKDDLEKIKKDVQDTRTSLTAELNNFKTQATTGLADAKKADMNNLMSRFNLDFADPQRLMEGFAGPAVLGKYYTVIRYVELARKYMPAKKEKEAQKEPERPRPGGADIAFPTPAAPPRFWLKTAKLDGSYESIAAQGGLSDLSTDQGRTEKPFKVNLSGQQAGQQFLAGAVMDHTGELPVDSLKLEASNIPVTDLIPGAQGGAGKIGLDLRVGGDDGLNGALRLAMSGVKLDPAMFGDAGGDKLKTEFVKNIQGAIEGMKEIVIEGTIGGTMKDPSLKLNSNLTGAIAGAIKSSVGNLVGDQKKELEGKLNTILLDRQKDLNGKLAGLGDGVNGRLGGLEAEIQKKISEATGLGGGSSSPVKIPNLKGLFKK